MKSLGITRPLDSLGRLVLPVELRRAFDLKENDPVEIYVEGDAILLKKHQAVCVFCARTDDLTSFKDKAVCKNCLKELGV